MKRHLAVRWALALLVSIPLGSGQGLCLDVDAGISWLRSHQSPDGSWETPGGGSVRGMQATAAALEAISLWDRADGSLSAGRAWLDAHAAERTEELAWKITVPGALDPQDPADLSPLLALGADGVWGVASGLRPEILDTAWALRALKSAGGVDPATVQPGISFLAAAQNPDGGWGFGSNASDIFLTAQVLEAVARFRDSFLVEETISRGIAFLRGQVRPDGAIGQDVVSTAAALAAAILTGEDVSASFPQTQPRLAAIQAPDGSWDGDVFTTATVLRALSRWRP